MACIYIRFYKNYTDMNLTSISKAQLIAACGLYCSNCTKYTNGKCPGCKENTKATWCKIRNCCFEKQIANCAECLEHSNPKECGKYNNIFSKTIEFISKTDRSLCIQMIRNYGNEYFADRMAASGKMSLPKQKKTSV
jgi:hypothetical protein